jgi:hypothetical protein
MKSYQYINHIITNFLYLLPICLQPHQLYQWCVRIAFFPNLNCILKNFKEIIEGVAFGLVRPNAKGSGYFYEKFIIG